MSHFILYFKIHDVSVLFSTLYIKSIFTNKALLSKVRSLLEGEFGKGKVLVP